MSDFDFINDIDDAGNSHLLDETRSVHLCDQGACGYVAATALSSDGDEHFVLARCDGLDDPEAAYDYRCRDVAHEQIGRLPRNVRDRIWDLRCGRPTRSGHPCQRRVAEPGQSCGMHEVSR